MARELQDAFGGLAMHVVYEAADLIDAHPVRHALEPAGIPVFRGEALRGGIGELPACVLVAVCVAGSRWPRARVLVEGWPLSAPRRSGRCAVVMSRRGGAGGTAA